ncbi:alpha-1A adrenergic receptor-like isoform X1 [Artemia franciscana]|uniref:alpha-1A adrenergic receptor-like isoform X1 n=1 Tax=Artemia franciscana TaxID=6661 RepID=UPI0032D9E3BF
MLCEESNTTSNGTVAAKIELNFATISLSIGLGIIVLLTVCGNLLILCAVGRSKNLRSPTHIFIVNLAVADLLLGTLVLPFSAVNQVTQKWDFGLIFCDVWAAVDVLCCTASILSLCAISVDRYIGVTRPLNYSVIITHRLAVITCLMVWMLSLIISIGPLVGWKQPNEDPDVCEVNMEVGYVLFSVAGSFYLPMLIILALYWKIYKAAVKQTKHLKSGILLSSDIELRVHRGRSLHQLKEQTTDQTGGFLQVPERRQSNSSITSNLSPLPEHRRKFTRESFSTKLPRTLSISPAKRFNPIAAGLASKVVKFKREKKAAKTLGIVVGAFLFCWFPFFFILPLHKIHRCHNESCKYILLAVSIFTHYAYAIRLRSKRGDEVSKSLESILEDDCYKKIQTDLGSELVNPHIKKVLLKYNIIVYHSHTPIKAALAERLIGTVRLLISRYITSKNAADFIYD